MKPRCPLVNCNRIMGQYARYCKKHMALMPDHIWVPMQLCNTKDELQKLHLEFVKYLRKVSGGLD